MNEGHKKLTGSSCGDCIHESVCCYRKDFLDICKAVGDANVHKLECDGKTSMKKVIHYDILDEIVIKCKHYYDGAKIRIDSNGFTLQSYPKANLCDYNTATTADNPNVGYTLTNNETKIVNVNNQL